MYVLDSGDTKVSRKNRPHHATITIKIDIREILSDGSLDPVILDNFLLEQYGISTKAQLCISGPTEADCINNLIKLLERLNG